MEKIGLVLEGGAMRGLYTIGVLDVLLENEIFPNYVIGVSAGASNGVSYVAKQKERAYRVIMENIKSPKYVGLRNFIKTKSMFGMDYLFDEIPNQIDPLDYDYLTNSDMEFVVGTTDVKTGKPVYFTKEEMRERDCTILRASSAIPILSPIVKYKDGEYLDGGTSDPIPVRKAIEDGCDKLIIVLTQHHGFVKQPEKLHFVYKHMFKDMPQMIKILDNRHAVYNETIEYINTLEKMGKAIVIAPTKPILISRFEKNRPALDIVYKLGRKDITSTLDKVVQFIK